MSGTHDRPSAAQMAAPSSAGSPPDWVGELRRQPWSDLDRYDRASIAVDCVLLTVEDRRVLTLVYKRDSEPRLGRWALPGAFVRYPQSDEDTVRQVALKQKLGVELDGVAYIEHLDWSAEPVRDDRGWVVTHAYLALAPVHDVRRAIADASPSAEVTLAPVLVPWSGERGDPVYVDLPSANDSTGPIERTYESLAWDHNQLVGLAIKRLRGKLRYTDIALNLMPDEFTLRQFQDAYEAVLDEPIQRTTFRRLVLDERDLLDPVNDPVKRAVGRQGQVYRRR